MNNTNLFNIILGGLLGVSALLSILFAFDIVSEGMLIMWCYALLAIAAAAAIVFPIMTMVKDLKKAKTTLLSIAVLAVICVISYIIAGGEEFVDRDGTLMADASTSKLSGAGLISFYILGGIAIVAIVYSEISKALK